MTKIFKKTFAILIAVITMISSFPYMALAEQSASVIEGGTTAEMTNSQLEEYIDSKIGSVSIILPQEQLVATADKEYMSGIRTTAKLNKFVEYTILEFNSSQKVKFGTSRLQYAVAIYTGQNDDIRFPVVFSKYFLNNNDSTSCYIRYVSIPQDVNNFEFVKDWERCNGELDLTYDKDPQCFSSKYNGDHLTNNSFRMNENKYWRNYIKYTSSGDEEKYYEALPTSLDIGFQYANTTVTGSLTLKHNSYVLNLAPYKNILDNLNLEYTQIKENSSLYTDESVNNYYKAVRDILDFDIKDLLSKMTLNNYFIFDNEIAEIATKVKTVVENYNSAKNLKLKSEIDFTAYNAAKEQCDTIIGNQTNNNEYDSNSYEEFKKIYDDVTAKAETVKTQKELNDLTAQLITAQAMLRKREITITVNIYRNDSTKSDYTEHYYGAYGERFNIQIDSLIDKTKESVKCWIISTDHGNTVTKVGSIDTSFTLYETKDAVVDAYVVPFEDAVGKEYSRVIFCGFNGKIIDVKYLEKDVELTSAEYKNAPEVPFYDFESWDKDSIIGTGQDIFVRAKYTAKEAEKDYCTVYYDGFDGGKKKYSYDSYVSLAGAKDDEYYALASTPEGGDSILTYLDCKDFYVPRTKELYVVRVNKEDRVAKVAIMGNFSSTTKDGKNRASFNCKFYLPEDCRLIEWGTMVSANNKTKAIKGDKLSKCNEYTISIDVSKTSSVKAFTGVAFVSYSYKDSNNKEIITTIYSQPVTQEFA